MDLYYELKVFVILKNDIMLNEVGYGLSKLITSAMCKDCDMIKLHNLNKFKLYCFDNLYPLAVNNVYKKGNMYSFRIRSPKEEFIENINNNIIGLLNKDFVVVNASYKEIRSRSIEKLISLTPVNVTLIKDQSSKVNGYDYISIESRLLDNLKGKYEELTGKTLELNKEVIKMINITSKPIAIKYKGVGLISVKFNISLNKNEESQILGYIAESCGLGEKNSACGFGFCHAVYEKNR